MRLSCPSLGSTVPYLLLTVLRDTSWGFSPGGFTMARRHSMSRGTSRRVFSRGASHTHRKNVNMVMRGGIRL